MMGVFPWALGAETSTSLDNLKTKQGIVGVSKSRKKEVRVGPDTGYEAIRPDIQQFNIS